MKAGAVEFLTKPCRTDVLLRAIGQAVEQTTAALHQEAQMQSLRGRYEALSRREREVMVLVVAGGSTSRWAASYIREITVKAQRSKVMRTVNARPLPELVTMAAMLGLSAEPVRQGGRLVAMATSGAEPDTWR